MATEIDKFIFSLALDTKQFKKGEKDTLAAIKNIRNAFTTTYQLLGGVKLLGGIIQDFKNLNLQMDALAKRTGESAAALDKWGRAAETLGKNKNSVFNDIDRLALLFNSPQRRLELFSKLPLVGLSSAEAGNAKSVTDLLIKIADASRNKFNTREERSAALQNHLGLSPDTVGMMLDTKNLGGFVSGMKSRVSNETIQESRQLNKEIMAFKDALDELEKTLQKPGIRLLTGLLKDINDFFKDLQLFFEDKDALKIFFHVDDIINFFKPKGLFGKKLTEEDKKHLKSWSKALGVPWMDPDAKLPEDLSILHPFESSDKLFNMIMRPSEQAAVDRAIASSLIMGSLGPASNGGKFNPFTAYKNDVVTAGEYELYKRGALLMEETPLSLKEYSELMNKIPWDKFVMNLMDRGTMFMAGGMQAGKFYQQYWDATKKYPVGMENTIKVDSPNYVVNISTYGSNPEEISAAAQEGVEAANNNLSGMLYRSMKDMTYSGAGMEQYSPPASR